MSLQTFYVVQRKHKFPEKWRGQRWAVPAYKKVDNSWVKSGWTWTDNPDEQIHYSTRAEAESVLSVVKWRPCKTLQPPEIVELQMVDFVGSFKIENPRSFCKITF